MSMASMSGIKYVVSFWLLTTVTGRINLVDNGYENIFVSISSRVSEDSNLITRLETYLTEASAALFKATNNQLYFKEFIFIVPDTWQFKDSYENADDTELTEADIIINHPSKASGDTPYVVRSGRCGVQGQYLHLTPNFVLDDGVRLRYGSTAKLIVHEWGHFRWGLFDEFPTAEDEQFYRYGDKWYPTRCTTEVDGELKNVLTWQACQFDYVTGKPQRDCEFVPSADNKAVSSLMFMHYLENVGEFCDDPLHAPKQLRHNKLAPNRQNRLCGYQSAWEVMRKHPDFINRSLNTAMPDTTDTRPNFRFVQNQPRRRVLVLDTSESMEGAFLNALRHAVGNFILSSVEIGSQLGMVRFASTASTLAPLRTINTDRDKETMLYALPTLADGRTSIGSGLTLGLQELARFGHTRGGTIILITDGQESDAPLISDVLPSILQKGVVVHVISLGQDADNGTAELAQLTGGKIIFFSGNAMSTALIDGFAATVAPVNGISYENTSLSILTDATVVVAGTPSTGSFFIDSTIGRETTLTFSYTEYIEVDIQSPDGLYKVKSTKNYFSFQLLKITLEDDLAVGLWRYSITTTGSSSSITINIQSKPKEVGGDILQVQSWLPENRDVSYHEKAQLEIYTEVTMGRTPVLDAIVTATVEAPNSDPFDVLLKDNGIGSDVIADDGIYSASVVPTDFIGDGRYNIKIKAVGTKELTKVIVSGQGYINGALEPTRRGVVKNPTETSPLEDFQRVTTAGEFRVSGYINITSDGMPPARITNLRATAFVSSTRLVTLAWTAVGGDTDRGQASRYLIYISHDLEDLLGNRTKVSLLPEEHVTRGNLSSPLTAGDSEELDALIKSLGTSKDDTVYIALVAVDEAGNEGQLSNVVSLSQAEELSIPGAIKMDDEDSTALAIGLSVGLVCLLVTLIGIVLIALRCRRSGRGKTDLSNPTTKIP